MKTEIDCEAIVKGYRNGEYTVEENMETHWFDVYWLSEKIDSAPDEHTAYQLAYNEIAYHEAEERDYREHYI